ncbi:uncharacterized protein [Lolium perenne]|uniref:uncharacterized protein isoform X2 n=1 Tax=Lolium perenne TaxID=4522 RepID=UPI0021F52270|nr:uncharacterized protein LOC127306580 isoform X2 [Lolium perenne]
MEEGFNKKRAVLTLSQEPEVGAMAAAPVGTVHWSKWSSLPGDLVRRIADSFLASNDLDHYMCLRAVCTCWRSATDEPKDNASDPRFQPRRWIVLDEVFQTEGKLLLLNTDTGRFLHKKLPLLREYYVVATTPSGFFVLADRSPPHAARVFNPLTGDLTRFVAPMPPEVGVAEVICDKGALYLHFLGDSTCKIYMALPGNQGFVSTDCGKKVYNIFRDAILGGAYPQRISGPALVAAFVGLDAQLFLHIEIQGRTPFVFKMNNGIGKIEPVESIGRFAIFIGHHGCLAVDADKFPGMEANCIYYTQDLGSSAHICKYNIKDKKVERLSEVAEFMKQDKKFVLVTARPSTIIQLLCSYTIKCRDSELVWQQTL